MSGDATARNAPTRSCHRELHAVHEEAVAKGLVTDLEVDTLFDRIAGPNFAVFSRVMFAA